MPILCGLAVSKTRVGRRSRRITRNREVVVKFIGRMLVLAIAGVGLSAGCRDNTPPPPNVPVPTAENPESVRTHDPIKPLPGQAPVERQDPQP